MNSWLLAIIIILIGNYLITQTVSFLNLKALAPTLPSDFKEVFDEKEYRKSQEYTRETTRISLIESTITLGLTIFFIFAGGFNYIDIVARSFGMGPIITGLIFTTILALISFILSLPFSLYSTFVIEEKFGFNKTTIRTFFLDILKMFILSAIIGGPILALVIWFFSSMGNLAWVYCWAGMVIISLVLQFLAPVLIMPLFNKFTPLEEGELKSKITDYAKQQKFSLQGIYTMDGSKRSTKLNAFFTGFGKFRKIVFYDTLIKELSIEQIVAVLAHEMGHYKLRHIFKMLTASILQTGFIFYLLSLILNNESLFAAFKMDNISVYASLIFFGFLYTPVSFFISIILNIFSRKHEYEADEYAAKSSRLGNDLISGLKVLSRTNLVNLTPHPLYVFMHYSHPPLLERINALRNVIKETEQ